MNRIERIERLITEAEQWAQTHPNENLALVGGGWDTFIDRNNIRHNILKVSESIPPHLQDTEFDLGFAH